MTGRAATAEPATLRLTDAPTTRRAWLADVRAHLPVLLTLARTDFRTRYKRAAFGVAWAVALPLVQAGVLAFVFSRVARFDLDALGVGYGAYVVSGVVVYAYVSATLPAAVTGIVDHASLADKVWFPRAVLVLVPCLANAVGAAVAAVAAVAVAPALGGALGMRSLAVVAALALAGALTAVLGLVLGAEQVWFRDVRFLVQTALLVLVYLTPVIYPRAALGRWEWIADANPLTGPVALAHVAIGVEGEPLVLPIAVSLGTIGVLAVVAVELHRRLDRLFVDQL